MQLINYKREALWDIYFSYFGFITEDNIPDPLYDALYDHIGNKANEKSAYYYHTDHLGSSSMVVYEGKIIQRLEYSPFGELWYDKRYGDWETMYTFSGKERDAETGLSYFGARYYDSDKGIWLSVDPLLDKYPSFSPYVYCANNPVMYYDPDGRWIPGLDDNGNTIYTSEKGDNLYTFQKQFGLGGKESLSIFNQSGLSTSDEASFEAGKSIIGGDIVKKVTGNDVLKGQWSNLTNTQKASQIMFGILHANETGNYDDYGRVNLNDYIEGFSISPGVTYLENVQIPVKGGKTIKVEAMSIPYAISNDPPTVVRLGQPINGPDRNGVCTQTYLTGKNPRSNYPTEAFVIKFNAKYYNNYKKSYY